jgi:hypothetical protein
VATGTDLAFPTTVINTGGLAFDGTSLTLTAGTWEVEVPLFINSFSDVNGLCVYNIVNAANGVIANSTNGVTRPITGTPQEGSSVTAYGTIVVPAGQTQVVKARATNVQGTCAVWEGGSRFIARRII